MRPAVFEDVTLFYDYSQQQMIGKSETCLALVFVIKIMKNRMFFKNKTIKAV